MHQHKGFTIYLERHRGQWRSRLLKPRGVTFRASGEPEEISEFVSASYTDKEFAIAQAKLLIDSGRVA